MIRKIMDIINRERGQFLIFFAIYLVILLLAFAIYRRDQTIFVSRLGPSNPFIAITVAAGFGALCFSFLINQGWFQIFKVGNARGYLVAVGVSFLFGAAAIFLDHLVRYSPEMNVLFPESLAYYPVVGFVAEIIFHVLLVAITSGLLRLIFPTWTIDTVLWLSILIPALFEPVYQIVFATAKHPPGANLLTALHVFLINFAQLLFFRKYDFTTMYAFRLGYYLIWHIIWGMLRLEILF